MELGVVTGGLNWEIDTRGQVWTGTITITGSFGTRGWHYELGSGTEGWNMELGAGVCNWGLVLRAGIWNLGLAFSTGG